MGVGLFLGFVASATSILYAVLGQFDRGPNAYRDVWIMAGVTLLAGVVFGLLGRRSWYFLRLLYGFCAVTAVGALATAVICLLTDQAKYAAPYAFWIATCVGAILIADRIKGSFRARRAADEAAAVIAEEVADEQKYPPCGPSAADQLGRGRGGFPT
jgi:hypothetical protein